MSRLVVHINGQWLNDEPVARYTACGHASATPKYATTLDVAKVTCKRCLHHEAAITALKGAA